PKGPHGRLRGCSWALRCARRRRAGRVARYSPTPPPPPSRAAAGTTRRAPAAEADTGSLHAAPRGACGRRPAVPPPPPPQGACGAPEALRGGYACLVCNGRTAPLSLVQGFVIDPWVAACFLRWSTPPAVPAVRGSLRLSTLPCCAHAAPRQN